VNLYPPAQFSLPTSCRQSPRVLSTGSTGANFGPGLRLGAHSAHSTVMMEPLTWSDLALNPNPDFHGKLGKLEECTVQLQSPYLGSVGGNGEPPPPRSFRRVFAFSNHATHHRSSRCGFTTKLLRFQLADKEKNKPIGAWAHRKSNCMLRERAS
jgi:hypothetical protein